VTISLLRGTESKKYLKVIHLNDSLNECGTKKDRHCNIGYGKIGFNTLLDIAYDPRTKNICKILETPVYRDEIYSYSNEISIIKEKKFKDWIKK